MAQCDVSGNLMDLSGTAIEDAVIKAEVITPVFSTTTLIVPTTVSTTSDASGDWTLSLLQGAECRITIEYPPNDTDSRKILTYSVTIPAASTADFSDLATEL